MKYTSYLYFSTYLNSIPFSRFGGQRTQNKAKKETTRSLKGTLPHP